MPSWWTRNSHQATQDIDRDRASTTRKKKKQIIISREKPKGFDQASLLRRSSSHYGSSVYSDSDSDVKAYPLPRPSASCRTSMESNKRFGRLESISSSSSEEFASDDDSTGNHEGFDSLRVIEENKSSSSSNASSPGSKASVHASSKSLSPWDAVESPKEKHDNGRHPCHRLPLPPASPTTPSKRSQLKWKRGKLLGRGTFGHVYAGFNSENGQMCAMKEVRLANDDKTSKECLKQLNQEITLLSELSHPNIVQYYGSNLGEENLSVYLEYVSGGSIQKLLSEYGAFEEPVIRSYTRQILSGLAYLHGRNTVHRDIKGSNILVDPNGEIKLADFGMAKHISSVSSMLSFKGSPYWMAPEVILNTPGNSLAVDIWSLGCTIFEMATSKPPWSKYEGVAAIFKIANSKNFPEIPPSLSEDAQDFIKHCLQRDPSARPTAVQLLQHPFVQDHLQQKQQKSILLKKPCLQQMKTLHGNFKPHSKEQQTKLIG